MRGKLIDSHTARERVQDLLPLFPQHWPTYRRLHNSSLIDPWQHGDGLEGLSGIYTVVNGFSLAMARRRPLTRQQAETLLEAGVHFLATHASLERCLGVGVRLELWLRLADAIRERLERVHDRRFFLDQPLRGLRRLPTRDLLQIIEGMMVRQEPVMLMLRGCRYTNVVGYTEHSLLLFDSGGRKWIRRASCAAVGEAALHAIYAPSLTTITT